MALAFLELQTEVAARGFSYLNDAGAGLTRLKRFINAANHAINDGLERGFRWQYMMASTTATPSAAGAVTSITDIDEIESVTVNSSPLVERSRSELVHTYGELTSTGTPLFYYMTGTSSFSVYPVATSTVTVTYWKVTTDLSANGDAPAMPDRFREAIVELACAYAYRDQNNREMAAVCQAEADRIVARMRSSYAVDSGPQSVVPSGFDQC